ncbi:MAG TPA: aldo/keto reductase [Steroidobacteraceae bacterium]|jgi:aryl-alcohol dehydrogenase-like predicted oxidoreductase
MIPRIALEDGYTISRIIKGGWHLAGDHGAIDPEQARKDMASFVEKGITTFDCADIYTGVEELIGAFRRAYPTLAKGVQVHTKFVPDLPDLATLDRRYVEGIIDRSLRRLGVERLDLVQFHWWDFEVHRYVETALELDRLRRAGKIARVGVTNFDEAHLKELLEAGVPIAAHQLQYSLIDDRPSAAMLGYCRAHGIALLCYGTVCGGFLSERWLGLPDPGGSFSNRSLVKYKLVIDDFGGWGLFQELLAALAGVARRHATDIASVATTMMLDRPGIAAAIVGATNAEHLQAHAMIGALQLDANDLAAIASVTTRRCGPKGDVYVLERDRSGRHGQIMKYKLNATADQRHAMR